MKRLFASLCVAIFTLAAWAVSRDNYTVIISLDGFRWDYPETFDTPFLDQMAHDGVKAVMTPSFPSKTFPNHYTLATGLVPDHHGIINNTFVSRSTGVLYAIGKPGASDPSFYGGDPIWLTAKRQGVMTATIFWVGSDVAIQGDHANYWHDYGTEARKMSYAARCDEVVRLLALPEGERPHLVMAYIEDPDANGHRHGPISRPTRRAMERLDILLEQMWQQIQMLPHASKVNLIVTGDHGMTWLSSERQIRPSDYLKKEWIASMDNDFPVLINATKPKHIADIISALKDVPHIHVWRKGEVPAYLDYGNNPNMSDIVVLPDIGWYFDDRPLDDTYQGSHGFDHTYSDMWVAFRAVGPDFRKGYQRDTTFSNVSIYPLLCHLLCVTPSPNDGSLNEVMDLLTP